MRARSNLALSVLKYSLIILFMGAVVYAAPKIIDFDVLNDLTVGNDLSVGNDLTVTGTIDGVDISALANDTLSNLGTTVINTDLISDTNITDDLGTSSIRWKDLHVQRVTGEANSLTVKGSSILWVDGTEGVSGECLVSSDTSGTASFTACPGASGNSWSDVVDADIIPDANNTRDIGNDSTRMAEMHTGTIGATEVTGNNPATFINNTSMITGDNASSTTNFHIPFNATFFGQTNNVSAFAWVKTTDTGSVNTIFSHYQTGGNRRKWAIATRSDGVLEIDISADGGLTNFKSYKSRISLNNDDWWHVGFTFTTNTLAVYVNGQRIDDSIIDKVADGTVNTLFNNTTDGLMIGAFTSSGTTGTNTLDGNIDDVTYWSVVLDADEVRELYNAGRVYDYSTHSQTAALEARWRGEGSVMPTLDEDINSQDATRLDTDSDITTADSVPALTADSLEVRSQTEGDILIQAGGGGSVLFSGATIDFSDTKIMGADLVHHGYKQEPTGDIQTVRLFLSETAGTYTAERDNSIFLDSITDDGPGNLTLNFVSGYWTVAPNCFTTTIALDSAATMSNPNTGAVGLDMFTTSTGVRVDTSVHLLCYGEATR